MIKVYFKIHNCPIIRCGGSSSSDTRCLPYDAIGKGKYIDALWRMGYLKKFNGRLKIFRTF
jgi:hypothetical protein